MTTPTNVTFIYDNPVDSDDTEITPSSEVATLPADNIKSRHRTKVWRTQGYAGEGEFLNIFFNQRKTVKVFGLLNHNLAGDDQIVLQGNNNPDFSGAIPYEKTFYAADADEGTTGGGYGVGGYGVGGYGAGGTGTLSALEQPYRNVKAPLLIFLAGDDAGDDPAYQYWKVRFLRASHNPQTYIEVGKLFLCDYFESSTNYLYGINQKLIDGSQAKRNSNGYDMIDEKETLNGVDFDIARITDSEAYNNFQTMYYQVGKKKFFILSLRPYDKFGRAFKTFYGRFENDLEFVNNWRNQNKARLGFREVM